MGIAGVFPVLVIAPILSSAVFACKASVSPE
jgi:hypothetical protein